MIKEQIVNDVASFREHLLVQSDSQNTAKVYCSAVLSFLFHFAKTYSRPSDIPAEIIISYLLRFENLSTRRNAHSALKRYYTWKSKNGVSTKFRFIPYPEKSDTIPDHVTMQDFKSILTICRNPKHKCVVVLGFDGGLRVSEVVNLKITDIDSKSMNIHIRQGKGKKDRILKLTQFTLDCLREYFLAQKVKPTTYLFNGDTFGEKYSVRSCQLLFKSLCKKAKVKNYKFHALRHGFAMALYETGGYSLETIRDLLGHSTVKTTQIYARKNNNVIQRTLSPMELLKQVA